MKATQSKNSTGDIFARSPYYGGAQTEPSAESCDILFVPASRIPTEHGCVVGPEVRYQDESGHSRSFEFVCHGPRSELLQPL